MFLKNYQLASEWSTTFHPGVIMGPLKDAKYSVIRLACSLLLKGDWLEFSYGVEREHCI